MVIKAGGSLACQNCTFSDYAPAPDASAANQAAPVVRLRRSQGVWNPAQAWLTATRFAHDPAFGDATDIEVDSESRVYSDTATPRVRAASSSAEVGVWLTSRQLPGERGGGSTRTLRAASFATENSPSFQAIMRVRACLASSFVRGHKRCVRRLYSNAGFCKPQHQARSSRRRDG